MAKLWGGAVTGFISKPKIIGGAAAHPAPQFRRACITTVEKVSICDEEKKSFSKNLDVPVSRVLSRCGIAHTYLGVCFNCSFETDFKLSWLRLAHTM